MIKTFLAPYETYLWAALAIILLVGGIVMVHHIETIGVDRQKAADAKLAQAQIVHKEEVESRAQELIAENDRKLHESLVAPDPVPTVAVRVCPRAAPARPVVPANGGTVSGSPGTGGLPDGVASQDAGQGVDIAPDTEALLARANAKLAYWQKFYETCKAEGACK